MKRTLSIAIRNALRPRWILKRIWLRLQGVRIGSGAWVAPGARIERQGGAISIGARTTIHEGALLLASGGTITLGCDCSVNPGCILYGHGGLQIGDDVRIAAYTVFVPANHCFDDAARPIREQGESRLGIRVGNDVWFGAHVTVLDGVAIADGCVIAAGCVVTRSTEPLGIYLGNPARLARYRGDRRGE